RPGAAACGRLSRAARGPTAGVGSLRRRRGRRAGGGRRGDRVDWVAVWLLALDGGNPDPVRKRQLGSPSRVAAGEGQRRPLRALHGSALGGGNRVGGAVAAAGFRAAPRRRVAGVVGRGSAGGRTSLLALLHPGHLPTAPACGAPRRFGSPDVAEKTARSDRAL